jgi:hypothetical protein
MRCDYRILVGTPEWKRAFERPKLRWEDTIEIDFREIYYVGVDVVQLLRVVAVFCGLITNLKSFIRAGNFLSS